MAERSNGYDQGFGLARGFLQALEQLQRSESAPRLLGAGFVQAYTAVKALEYDSYLTEISAWERRFLLPQV
jgi:glutamine synthetase